MLLNVNQICRIDVHEKSVNRWYSYIPITKTGILKPIYKWMFCQGLFKCHLSIGAGCLTAEEVNAESDKYYVEGEVVYYYPHIELHMADQSTVEKYFDTVDKLNFFLGDELLSKIPTVKI